MVQFLKAPLISKPSSLISFKEAGNVISVRLLQLEKAPTPNVFKFDGKIISFKFLQLLKDSSPNLFNEEGKSISSRLSQSKNISSGISVKQSGKMTFFKLSQFPKHLLPIDLIFSGIVISVNPQSSKL